MLKIWTSLIFHQIKFYVHLSNLHFHGTLSALFFLVKQFMHHTASSPSCKIAIQHKACYFTLLLLTILSLDVIILLNLWPPLISFTQNVTTTETMFSVNVSYVPVHMQELLTVIPYITFLHVFLTRERISYIMLWVVMIPPL